MKLAALAGFAAGTAIVVYTFLRQHSDSEIVITVSLSKADIEAAAFIPESVIPDILRWYGMDGAGYEPAPPAVILADPQRN